MQHCLHSESLILQKDAGGVNYMADSNRTSHIIVLFLAAHRPPLIFLRLLCMGVVARRKAAYMIKAGKQEFKAGDSH